MFYKWIFDPMKKEKKEIIMIKGGPYSRSFGATLALCWLIAAPQVASASWTTPVAVSTTVSDQPNIALDTTGNATLFWQGFDGSNYVIQSADFPIGGSWSSPTQLSASGEDSQSPFISLDRYGNAAGIWSRFDGTSSVIQGISRPFGGSWSSPVNISDSGFNADSPFLSMDYYGTTGNSLAVWHRYNGSNFIVQVAALPMLGTWSAALNISPSGQDALIPMVAIDPNGNAAATCARYNGTIFNANSAMMLEGQNWNPSFVISNSGAVGSDSNVDVDGNGNATIAWSQSDGSNYVIMTSSIPYGGSATTPITLSQSGEDAYVPVVHAATSTGDVVVVWIRSDGSNLRAQAIQLPFGGSWSSVTDLSTVGVNVANIQLSVTPSGQAIAVWDENDGTNSTVHAATLASASSSWGSNTTISSSGAYAYFPVVDTDNAGDATAAWLQLVGSDYNVFSSSLPAGS